MIHRKLAGVALGIAIIAAGAAGTLHPASASPAAVDKLKFNPSPIAPSGSLGAGAPVTVTVTALSARVPVPNEPINLSLTHLSPTTTGGTAAVGTTALTSTPQPFNTDSTGVITISYKAPNPTQSKGRDIITAADVAIPTVTAKDIYVSAGLAAYVYNPAPPIAPAGSLGAGVTVTTTLTAVDGSTPPHPVPGATILMSITTTATSGGSATVTATNRTKVLTSSPERFVADANGSVSIAYTTPTPLPHDGTDTIMAQDHPTPSVSATDTYTYGGTSTVAAIRGVDGGLWRVSGADASSPVFTGTLVSLGGGIVGAPAVVSVPAASGPGTLYYFATGLNNEVWVRSDTTSWQLLTAGLNCTSSPAATAIGASTPGQGILTVACRGADGALWFAQATVASDPSILPALTNWSSLHGSIVGGPAIVAVPPFTSASTADLWFFGTGVDGTVWTNHNGTWSKMGWSCIGHLAAAAVRAPTSNLAAFACQGADHQLWASTNTGSGWVTIPLGGPIGNTIVDGPGIALGPNSLTVVAQGTDGHLYQRTRLLQGSTFGAWALAASGESGTNGAGAAAQLVASQNP